MSPPAKQPNPFQPQTDSLSENDLVAPTWERRRLWPNLWVRLLATTLIVSAIVVSNWEIVADVALGNVISMFCGILGVFVLSVWFVFFSGYSRRCRWLSLLTVIGILVAFFVAFRIDSVSGELIPKFRPKWTKNADELLGRPVVDQGAKLEVSSADTTHDFPQFLGPNRNGRVDGIELNRDWKQNPPQLRWRQSIGAGWSAFSAVGQAAVTLEQRGEEEFVTCYDIETGKLKWAEGNRDRHEHMLGGVGPRSTPTIHAGHVYAQGAKGNLVCLDLATGHVRWRDNLLDRYHVDHDKDGLQVLWGRAGSPLIVDDLVIVPAGGPAKGSTFSLVAFHKDTGALVWQAGEDQIGYSSPAFAVLADVPQILSVNEKTVTGHSPKTGEVLWKSEWPGNSTQDANASQPVPVGSDLVFLSKGYSGGAALLELTKVSDNFLLVKQRWHDPKVLKTKFTNVTIYRGHAYGLSDGTLECVEITTGERRWKKGRYAQGQILGVGNILLVMAENGEMAMVEAIPDLFHELGRFEALSGKTWNNICLAGKRLLVRNAEEAACYDLP